MARLRPVFAGAKTVAQLLDLKLSEFQKLVDIGAMPPPVFIGGKHPRWNVTELESQLRGDGLEECFQW